MSTPDWKLVLPTPPAGGRLQEAWMTSFEQPDAGAIGDDPDKPYLNPVSRGFKAYYDFKKTDADHSMAGLA